MKLAESRTIEMVYPACELLALSKSVEGTKVRYTAAFEIGPGYIDVKVTCDEYASLMRAIDENENALFSLVVDSEKITVRTA